MEWISVRDRMPSPEDRVLTYSPCYERINKEMLYRMLSGNVIKYCTDVKYWALPEPPKDD